MEIRSLVRIVATGASAVLFAAASASAQEATGRFIPDFSPSPCDNAFVVAELPLTTVAEIGPGAGFVSLASVAAPALAVVTGVGVVVIASRNSGSTVDTQ